MSLVEDTRLTELAPGRWSAVNDGRWAVIRGPYGGWLGALLARACEQVTDRPLRTLAVHFLDAPQEGELEVWARVLREGRSSHALELGIDQGGRPMARALASAGAPREGGPGWQTLSPPTDRGPDEFAPLPPNELPFLDRLDVRWVEGHPPVPPGGEAYNALWLSAGPLDGAALVALADVVVPPAFSALGSFAIVPTLDMTIHFRAPIPAGEEWVLAAQRSEHSAGGTWTCDGALWSRDGTLLAQTRQLAMLRT